LLATDRRVRVAQDETMTDFSDMARGIIESNRYMVLGTADEDGVPWVTPVWFTQSDHRRSSGSRRRSAGILGTSGRARR
jgi:predicted pyridoxine 5'-phosphate oxidase superfamily flavin-nucleotide-binding protein